MSNESHLYDRVEEARGYKWIVTKAGKRITFFDAERQAKRGLTTLWRALSRMSKLAQKHDEYDWDWEHIEWLLDDVERMLSIWREEVNKHRDRSTVEQRVAQLREVNGRTPEEAALYKAKADELERTLGV